MVLLFSLFVEFVRIVLIFLTTMEPLSCIISAARAGLNTSDSMLVIFLTSWGVEKAANASSSTNAAALANICSRSSFITCWNASFQSRVRAVR
jgi:hypothetical protein